MPSPELRLRLRAEVNATVPESPGVYAWLGASGEPLYVGKAVNLRRRMLSYLAPRAAAPESHIRHLAHGIAAFAWRPAAGELLALLLEDALIKRLEPRHNERQRDYRERRYLLLTSDAYPACLVVEAAPPRPGTLFGPFKDQYFVAELIELVREAFGLRACTDRDPFRRNARYDLGQCPGPCRGAVTRDAYGEAASRARAFLGGDETWVAARLAASMSAAAEELRFEDAAGLREQLAFVARFCARQRFVTAFREGAFTVDEPRFGLTYHFERGALAELRAAGGEALEVPPELREPPCDPRFALDRANLVREWLHRQPQIQNPKSKI